MRSYKLIGFLLVVVLLCACHNAPEVQVAVRECAPLPCGGRASACVAVLDDKAYIFSGRDSSGFYKNDLWVYDGSSDSWTSLGKTPLKARVNATMTAMDGVLYVGLGYGNQKAYCDSAYLHDWWSYEPSTKQWTRLADFPNANTVAPLSYSIGRDIYAIYGFGYGFTRNICVYSPELNQWTQWEEKSHRADYNCGGRGAMLNGCLYYGLGYNTHNLTQWYEVDLPTDTWKRIRSLPGKGREFAACAASNEHVYVFGGRYFGGDMTGGEVFETYMRYSPAKDQWEWCGTMPCGRAENQIAFSIGSKVYFGLGEDEKGHVMNQLYCIE